MKWTCLSVTVKVTFTSSTFFLTTSILSSSTGFSAAVLAVGLGAVSGGSGAGRRLSDPESLAGALVGAFCPRLFNSGLVSAGGCVAGFVSFGASLGGSAGFGMATAEGADGSSVAGPWPAWLAGACAITVQA